MNEALNPKVYTKEERIKKSIISGCVGSLIGILTSLIVTNALIEISENEVFASIFGICFIVLGAAVLWRVLTSEQRNGTRVPAFAFAALIILSGIFSFFLKNWLDNGLSTSSSIPIFCVISTSLCFSLVFCLVEFVNLGFLDKFLPVKEGFFDSKRSIMSVLGSGIFLGLIIGLLFGTVDVDDDNRHDRYTDIVLWCIPMGLLFGFGALAVVMWENTAPPKANYQWDPLFSSSLGTQDPGASINHVNIDDTL